jgi:hypothetical protein
LDNKIIAEKNQKGVLPASSVKFHASTVAEAQPERT